jgi:hypothetical protein
MKMDHEEEIALEESIADWKDRQSGKGIDRDCPLCILAKRKRRDSGIMGSFCNHCIIYRRTGRYGCRGTPFDDARGESNYHQLEIEFLESLRPEKNIDKHNYVKGAIEVGDKVYVRDSSWALQLCKGVARDITANISKVSYTVVQVKLCLPTDNASTRPAYIHNDTIVYNPDSQNYIFVRERCLDLITPRYCITCGKEN